MFWAGVIIFVAYTTLYALAGAAVIYHLKQYTLADNPAPALVIHFFLGMSVFLWLAAIFFLFLLPS